MRYWVELDGVEHAIDITAGTGSAPLVELTTAQGTRRVEVELSTAGGRTTVKVEGRVYDVVLDGKGPERRVAVNGRRGLARVESARQRGEAALRSAAGGVGEGTLTSPMPGKIVKVLVQVGDAVQRGQPLVVVEAMKMENELTAARAGTVTEVLVAPGDAVEGGVRLVVVG